MSDNKSNNIEPNKFLDDEPEDGVKYIKPNIEAKLDVAKRKECRDIVQEIKTFGISQRQLLYLIYLLSLEIENREVMLALTEAIGDNREKIKVSGIIVPD